MRRILPGVLMIWLGVALSIPGADIETLLKQAKSKDSDERRNAFKDLADAMGEAKLVLPTLLAGLKDDDRFVRRFAALAIGKTQGLDNKKVLPALTKLVDDKDESKEVQEAVVGAMSKMGKTAVDPLMKVLKDRAKEASVRARAADSLGVIGTDARAALPTLLEVVNERGGKNKDGSTRVDAIEALGKIASSMDKEALTALEGIAGEKSKDKALKSAVTTAIKSIKSRK